MAGFEAQQRKFPALLELSGMGNARSEGQPSRAKMPRSSVPLPTTLRDVQDPAGSSSSGAQDEQWARLRGRADSGDGPVLCGAVPRLGDHGAAAGLTRGGINSN